VAGARLILDSGALSALAAGEPRAIAWAFRATQHGMLYGVPAPVLAETLTGQPRDATIHRVLSDPALIIDTTEALARDAGVIRYRARAPEKTIDALVVASAAVFPNSIVLTSDPKDLTQLARYRADAGLAIRDVNAAASKALRQKRERPRST